MSRSTTKGAISYKRGKVKEPETFARHIARCWYRRTKGKPCIERYDNIILDSMRVGFNPNRSAGALTSRSAWACTKCDRSSVLTGTMAAAVASYFLTCVRPFIESFVLSLFSQIGTKRSSQRLHNGSTCLLVRSMNSIDIYRNHAQSPKQDFHISSRTTSLRSTRTRETR